MSEDITDIEMDSEDPAFLAGYDFVARAVPAADQHAPYPMWHGWAIKAAFWSGVIWQREQASQSDIAAKPPNR